MRLSLRQRMAVAAFLLVAAAGWAGLALPASQGASAETSAISFDDSAPDLIVIANDFYEVAFRKSNGSIAYIVDRATNRRVSEGSRFECLWGAIFGSGADAAGFVGGCSFASGWANSFSYEWSATAQRLDFEYRSGESEVRRLNVDVTITPSPDAWFDISATVTHISGDTLQLFQSPSFLTFLEADLSQALLPLLPGVMLNSNFFEEGRSYQSQYPGGWGFADFVWISSSEGSISIFQVNQTAEVWESWIGFVHDDSYLPQSTAWRHDYAAAIEAGETFAPPPVRILVGQSAVDAAKRYRLDNRLDQLPSLREKLGDIYEQVASSPLYKADANQVNLPYLDYEPLLFDAVPAPGLFHPVQFQDGDFDTVNPDWWPPGQKYGGAADFLTMIEAARNHGFLVMPYTNPTWWNPGSETAGALLPPTSLNDLAVIGLAGVPRTESYGAKPGVVVSPYDPAVKKRLADSFVTDVLEIRADLVFEDQIGARPWLFDASPYAPTATSYTDGWLDHTRAYVSTPLMTEGGFDRLAETEAGFFWSMLMWERRGDTDVWWGNGNWDYFPLSALLFRDKTLQYQHDLEGGFSQASQVTDDLDTFRWNLTFGYMFGFDLASGGPSHPWLPVVADFQRYVLSTYAGELLEDFTMVAPAVTRSTFETVDVLANGSLTQSYEVGTHRIVPRGAAVLSQDGSLTAGVFSEYGGKVLSPGDHFLIELRGEDNITVRQPMGADTSLAVSPLEHWSDLENVLVEAVRRDGTLIRSAPVRIDDGMLVFDLEAVVDEPTDVESRTQVSATLGATSDFAGLTQLEGADGLTTPAVRAGRPCRLTAFNGSLGRYVYFDVSDDFILSSLSDVFVEVDYFDEGAEWVGLDYDGVQDRWASGLRLVIENSGEWKTVQIRLRDAFFGNRQHMGADFRIATSDDELCIAAVRVVDAATRDRLTVDHYRIYEPAPLGEGEPGLVASPAPGRFASGIANTSDVAALAQAQAFDVVQVLAWDVPMQAWLTFIPGAPPAVNTLFGRLRPTDIITIVRGPSEGDASQSERQPEPPTEARAFEVPPAGGLTRGLAGTARLQDVLDAQPFVVLSITMFEEATGTALTYIPGAPDSVNTLRDEHLQRGSVLWLKR